MDLKKSYKSQQQKQKKNEKTCLQKTACHREKAIKKIENVSHTQACKQVNQSRIGFKLLNMHKN